MSCQDVCLSSDYDGSCEFWNKRTVRAGKRHVCNECRSSINVGETHEYMTGKSDGDFWTARTCAPCAEIRETFTCGGFTISTLWEDIYDQIFPTWNEITTIDCLARLTTDAAIARMRERYAAWKKV